VLLRRDRALEVRVRVEAAVPVVLDRDRAERRLVDAAILEVPRRQEREHAGRLELPGLDAGVGHRQRGGLVHHVAGGLVEVLAEPDGRGAEDRDLVGEPHDASLPRPAPA
jgi:hypothetical protein